MPVLRQLFLSSRQDNGTRLLETNMEGNLTTPNAIDWQRRLPLIRQKCEETLGVEVENGSYNRLFTTKSIRWGCAAYHPLWLYSWSRNGILKQSLRRSRVLTSKRFSSKGKTKMKAFGEKMGMSRIFSVRSKESG